MARDVAQRFRMPDVEARVQAAILAPVGDATSLPGAEKLRDAILNAWRKKGGPLPVITIVRRVYVVGTEERERFELMSNMKDGRPA